MRKCAAARGVIASDFETATPLLKVQLLLAVCLQELVVLLPFPVPHYEQVSFLATAMDSFFKKRTSSSLAQQNPSKRKRVATSDEEESHKLTSPRLVVAWNCNGLTCRLRADDGDAIKAFVARHNPDLIFLSEVRVCAANNSATGKAGPHTTWFRSRMRDSDKKSREDVRLVNSLLLNKPFTHYKAYFSLANTKYAGTAMLLNTDTMRAPLSVRYNLEGKSVKGSVHDPDGRVILAKFEHFTILHTYSPNNGWENTHFNRRRMWDENVEKFMKRMKAEGTQMMWVGDLNVAPKDVDLSHAQYFRKQKGGRYAKDKAAGIAPENVGQPGCTGAERNRFLQILELGDLVDAYRELAGEEDDSGLSWRGISTGRNGGRGMRIDHCIVSRPLLSSIGSVQITGHGAERVGFLGSDHCPIIIKCQGEQGKGTEQRTENGEAIAEADVRTENSTCLGVFPNSPAAKE